MADSGRLNGVIRTLEAGNPAFLAFCPPDISSAQTMASAKYDGIIFEMEHGPYDIRALRDCLQYMLNRRQIVESGSIAPAVTPIVRIPPNGSERSQWVAKQVLDSGVYGIVWPHVSTVEEAMNAVASCRYPRPESAEHYAPAGQRGDAPGTAARYWGIGDQEYYRKADVWPLAPDGEVLVVIQCEEKKAIANLPEILREVPGIGTVLIGEGDLSQDLGHPRQYDHPKVVAAMAEILDICQQANIPCGHPHVNEKNVERILDQGFRFLMPAPSRTYPALERGRSLANR